MVNESFGTFPGHLLPTELNEAFQVRPPAEWDRLRPRDRVKPSYWDRIRFDAHQVGTILERDDKTALVRWKDLSERRWPLERLVKVPKLPKPPKTK